MGSGDKIILIKGFNKHDIASARKSIASIVSSGRSKQDITHFVSVPCSTDEIRANFVKFRESILHDWHPGLDMKLFQKPEKLHLTLEVVVLLDEIDRSAAIEVFNECEQSIIKRILNGAQLNLRVEGIDIMNDDPSAANVLYAHVKSDHLQEIADEIAKTFARSGLVKRARDNVKLHMTLINSGFLEAENTDQREAESAAADNKKTSWRNFKRKPFDAREILRNFKEFYFGTVNVTEIHLSMSESYAENGYYKATAVIKL